MLSRENMKKIIFLGMAISLVLIFSIGQQVFKHKCFWWDCAPARNFTVYDLNLPRALFPAGAEIYPLEEDRGVIAAIDEAVGGGRWNNGGGYVYIAYKFATENQAIDWFEEDKKDHLITRSLDNLDQYKDILTYQSLVADDYDVVCGYVLEHVSCMTRARYEEFYIFFNGYITKNGMSQPDYLNIIRFIDQRMLELLN